MRRLSLLGTAACLGWLGACGVDGPSDGVCAEQGVVVADPTAWRVVVDDADDPWGPRADRCGPAQHRTETQADLRWHEVETRGCGAATLHQPARVDLCAGDTVAIDVWHFPITEGDGDWTLAFGVSGADGRFEEFTRYTVPLPGAATTFTARFELGRAVAMGDTLWVRLTNHGTNTWNIYSMQTVSSAP